MKFEALWEEFVKARMIAASTKKKWKPYFTQLIKRIGSDDMSRVTEQHLLDWRDALLAMKLSPVTVRYGYIASAQAFFGWAKRAKKLPQNPAAEVVVEVTEKHETDMHGFRRRRSGDDPRGGAGADERDDDRGKRGRPKVGAVALRLYGCARQRDHPAQGLRCRRSTGDPVHSDHFGGVAAFILDGQLVSRRIRPLTIAGPQGMRARLDALMEAHFPGASRVDRQFKVELLYRWFVGLSSGIRQASLRTVSGCRTVMCLRSY